MAKFEVSSGPKGMNNCEKGVFLYENKNLLPLDYKVIGRRGKGAKGGDINECLYSDLVT